MTLVKTMIKSLSEWRPKERQPLTVQLPNAGVSVTITADHCENLGAEVWEIAIRRGNKSGKLLQDWATDFAEARGLGDQLAVIEVDNIRAEAILRSEKPRLEDNESLYYEAVVTDNGNAVLRRYSANRTDFTRKQISFVSTHEATAEFVQSVVYVEQEPF